MSDPVPTDAAPEPPVVPESADPAPKDGVPPKPRRPGELSAGQTAAIVIPLIALVALGFTNPGNRAYMDYLHRRGDVFSGPSMGQAMQMAQINASTTIWNGYLFTVYETHCSQPPVEEHVLGIGTLFIPLPKGAPSGAGR